VPAANSFAGKLAVVTPGGGPGMGRELVRQLAARGCSVAACDWHADTVAETAATARAAAPSGVRVTSHVGDISDEAQVLRFRDELLEQHASDHKQAISRALSHTGAVTPGRYSPSYPPQNPPARRSRTRFRSAPNVKPRL
jgi:NAD(P)-dependent dehydrogenase (short-subunit alcohol dehydrogenase family)